MVNYLAEIGCDNRRIAVEYVNPAVTQALERKVESGDLMGFDTDMVGPMGYFADLSRTFHCGPDKPTLRQKQLYRLAMEEI